MYFSKGVSCCVELPFFVNNAVKGDVCHILFVTLLKQLFDYSSFLTVIFLWA